MLYEYHFNEHTCAVDFLGPPHSSRPFLEDPSLVFALSLFTWDSAMSALSSASSSSCCSLRSLARLVFAASSTVLQVFDGLLHILLHALQVVIAMLCIIQLQLSVALHLLLHPQGLISAPGLRFQRGLKGIKHPLVVLLGLLHFLIFLRQFSLQVCLHLVELQLGSQDLALFMFQGTFCLLQC
uniref:Uncharacterized protein n=1 Tax=Anabas testudineus TaxID=64144 RepID=A0A3Q1HKK6_ANATE